MWRPEQIGRHYSGDIFKCFILNGKCILIQVSLKFVPIGNTSALVQVMACDKPLLEPMRIQSADVYMRHPA